MHIDNELFLKYAHNELPKEEMAKVRAALIENDEIDAILYHLICELEERNIEDGLVAEEDLQETFFKEKEKIYDQWRQKISDVDYSMVSNKQTNTNMENLNFSFSKEAIESLANRCNDIHRSADSAKSLEENLSCYYAKLHPELSTDEVHDVISRLIKGSNTLTEKYNQAMKNDHEDFVTTIESDIRAACENMTLRQRFDFLVNALSVVQVLNLSAFDDLTDIKEEVKKQIEEYANGVVDPTEEDCNELITNLSEAINNNTLVLAGSDKLKELLCSAQDGKVSSIDFSSAQYDDARHKAEMSLAAWIEIEEENLNVPMEVRNPEFIGFAVASAVEQQKILNDVSLGIKGKEVAYDCLKTLLSITVSGALIFAAAGFTALAALGVAGAILMPSAVTILLAAVSVIVYVPFAYKLAVFSYHMVKETIKMGVETCCELYDYVRETIYPKVKEGALKTWDWVKTGLNKIKNYIFS